MTDERSALYQRICDYSLDDAKSSFSYAIRLAHDNGWGADFSRRVVDEYKRFMFLAVVADHQVTPSEAVDQAWHLHLLYTRSYWEDFCCRVLQTPIHHEPTKGGHAESTRFHDQYAKTLASYETWFNESPPSDIWPSAHACPGRPSRWVRVNVAASWVVPKPWARLRYRNATPLVVAGLSPMLVGAVNPLDFTGPTFLAFYTVACVAAVAAALILRRAMRTHTHLDAAWRPSAYEIACLAHSAPGALQAGLASLVGSGRLRIVESPPKKLGPLALGKASYRLIADEPTPSDDELELALTEAALRTEGAEARAVLEAAKPAADAIERRLMKKGLLESAESFRSARWWPLLIIAVVWLLGAGKVIIGVSRDKPVVFLLAGLVAMAIAAAAFARRPRRTLAGQRLFELLQTEYDPLRKADFSVRAIDSPNELAVAAALFGLAAVAHPEIRKLQSAVAPAPASCGGGSGLSGCGGGGCGGGGCGGGGCGGGGCGGCGG